MKLNVLLGDAYKEGMTADEIISALEKVADPNAEVEKLRNAVTKANGEAAEYKKQLKAKRTDDENAAQEQADKLAEMQKQIEVLTADKENLVKEKTLASYREKFVAQGYDAELANKAASALADGDIPLSETLLSFADLTKTAFVWLRPSHTAVGWHNAKLKGVLLWTILQLAI